MPIITILSVSKLNGDWGVTLNTRRYPNIKNSSNTFPNQTACKKPYSRACYAAVKPRDSGFGPLGHPLFFFLDLLVWSFKPNQPRSGLSLSLSSPTTHCVSEKSTSDVFTCFYGHGSLEFFKDTIFKFVETFEGKKKIKNLKKTENVNVLIRELVQGNQWKYSSLISIYVSNLCMMNVMNHQNSIELKK